MTPWQLNRLREMYRRELVSISGSAPPKFRLPKTFDVLVNRAHAIGTRIPRSLRKWIRKCEP